MAEMKISELDQHTRAWLVSQARAHRRSPEAEAGELLRKAAGTDPRNRLGIDDLLTRWQQRFGDRRFTIGSMELLREDRDR